MPNTNGWDKWKERVIYQLDELNDNYKNLNHTSGNLGAQLSALQQEVKSLRHEIRRVVDKRATFIGLVSGGVISLGVSLLIKSI